MANLNLSEEMIRNVVSQVLAEVGPPPKVASNGANQYSSAPCTPCSTGRHGVFHDANEAVAAAKQAFDLLSESSKENRKKAIDIIRRIANDQASSWARWR